jgi:hypothetical protein
MQSAAATAPRSTHPAETGSRTSAGTLALLQSPLFVDHQAMDTLSGRDLGELIDEKLGRGGHGTFTGSSATSSTSPSPLSPGRPARSTRSSRRSTRWRKRHKVGPCPSK